MPPDLYLLRREVLILRRLAAALLAAQPIERQRLAWATLENWRAEPGAQHSSSRGAPTGAELLS